MNIFAPMIRRPAGTSLLAIGLVLAGICAYFLLGVAALPSFELPVVFVSAAQPGASAQTMASTVLAPLERHLGQIPGIDEMYGNATEGSATVIVRFHFGRDTDKAARDVQAAINAAQSDLPVLPSPPQYFKADTASIPILLVTLKSDGLPIDKLYDLTDTLLQPAMADSGCGPGAGVRRHAARGAHRSGHACAGGEKSHCQRHQQRADCGQRLLAGGRAVGRPYANDGDRERWPADAGRFRQAFDLRY
jgi:hypothetical protein